MKYKHVFICTYGRSGSTLLQGVLNSLDGVLIRGENHEFCYELYKAFSKLKEVTTMVTEENDVTSHPWYGATKINIDQARLDIKKVVRNVLLGDKTEKQFETLGFKEIRYPYLSDLEEYLEFLINTFDKSAIIFNTRNIEETLKSGWWPEQDPVSSRKIISNFIKIAKNFNEKHADTFLIDYENVKNLDNKLHDLFDFLECKPNNKKLKKVLSVKHSYLHE